MQHIFKNHFSNEDYPLVLNCIDTIKSDWELGMQLLKGSGYYKPLAEALREYYISTYDVANTIDMELLKFAFCDKIEVDYKESEMHLRYAYEIEDRNKQYFYKQYSYNDYTRPFKTYSSKSKLLKIQLPLFSKKLALDLGGRSEKSIYYIEDSKYISYPIELESSEGEFGCIPQTTQKIVCPYDAVKLDKTTDMLNIKDVCLFGWDYHKGHPIKNNFGQCYNIETLILGDHTKLHKDIVFPPNVKNFNYSFNDLTLYWAKKILNECPNIENFDANFDENAERYLLEQGFIKDGFYYVKQK